METYQNTHSHPLFTLSSPTSSRPLSKNGVHSRPTAKADFRSEFNQGWVCGFSPCFIEIHGVHRFFLNTHSLQNDGSVSGLYLLVSCQIILAIAHVMEHDSSTWMPRCLNRPTHRRVLPFVFLGAPEAHHLVGQERWPYSVVAESELRILWVDAQLFKEATSEVGGRRGWR